MRAATGLVVVDTVIFDKPDAGINFDSNQGEEWILLGNNGQRRYSSGPIVAPEEGQSIDSVPADEYPATLYIVRRSTLPRT